MRLENYSRIPDKDLLRLFNSVISKTDLPKERKDALRKDAYIAVYNGKYSAMRGKIYAGASWIYRKGREIPVETYIKLYIFDHTTLDELAQTFAHELSHYRDYWLKPSIRMPRGKEARANAYADKIVKRLKA